MPQPRPRGEYGTPSMGGGGGGRQDGLMGRCEIDVKFEVSDTAGERLPCVRSTSFGKSS